MPEETLYRKVDQPDGNILFVAVQPTNLHVVDVPWVGMNTALPNDDYTKSDCGTSILAGWLRMRGVQVSVDDVSKATGLPPNFRFTTFADLDRAANKYGLDLTHQFGTLLLSLIRSEIDAMRPVIALVYYRSLPKTFDPNYAFSHWVLITGYSDDGLFYYHDAYWLTAAGGANISITSDQLEEALRNVRLNGNTSFQGATQRV